MSWILTFVIGAALGITSWWHGRMGGAGTTGAPFAAALLVVVVVALACVAAGVWARRSR